MRMLKRFTPPVVALMVVVLCVLAVTSRQLYVTAVVGDGKTSSEGGGGSIPIDPFIRIEEINPVNPIGIQVVIGNEGAANAQGGGYFVQLPPGFQLTGQPATFYIDQDGYNDGTCEIPPGGEILQCSHLHLGAQYSHTFWFLEPGANPAYIPPEVTVLRLVYPPSLACGTDLSYVGHIEAQAGSPMYAEVDFSDNDVTYTQERSCGPDVGFSVAQIDGTPDPVPPPVPGSSIRRRLVIKNNGDALAYPLNLQLIIPAGFDYVQFQSSDVMCQPMAQPQYFNCVVPGLQPGESSQPYYVTIRANNAMECNSSYTVYAKAITPGDTVPANDEVWMSGPTGPCSSSSRSSSSSSRSSSSSSRSSSSSSSSSSVVGGASADLAIQNYTLISGTPPFAIGQPAVYQVTIVNNGSATAQNPKLHVSMSSNADFIPSLSSYFCQTPTGTIFDCPLGFALPPGQIANITLAFKVQAGTPCNITGMGETVTAQSTTPDPNSNNNVSTIDIATNPCGGVSSSSSQSSGQADMQAKTIQIDGTPPLIGNSPTRFRFEVKNIGTVQAPNASFTVTLSPSLVFTTSPVVSDGDCVSVNNPMGVPQKRCLLQASLLPGNSFQRWLSVKRAPGAACTGTATVTLNAEMSAYDAFPPNNALSQTVTFGNCTSSSVSSSSSSVASSASSSSSSVNGAGPDMAFDYIGYEGTLAPPQVRDFRVRVQIKNNGGAAAQNVKLRVDKPITFDYIQLMGDTMCSLVANPAPFGQSVECSWTGPLPPGGTMSRFLSFRILPMAPCSPTVLYLNVRALPGTAPNDINPSNNSYAFPVPMPPCASSSSSSSSSVAGIGIADISPKFMGYQDSNYIQQPGDIGRFRMSTTNWGPQSAQSHGFNVQLSDQLEYIDGPGEPRVCDPTFSPSTFRCSSTYALNMFDEYSRFLWFRAKPNACGMATITMTAFASNDSDGTNNVRVFEIPLTACANTTSSVATSSVSSVSYPPVTSVCVATIPTLAPQGCYYSCTVGTNPSCAAPNWYCEAIGPNCGSGSYGAAPPSGGGFFGNIGQGIVNIVNNIINGVSGAWNALWDFLGISPPPPATGGTGTSSSSAQTGTIGGITSSISFVGGTITASSSSIVTTGTTSGTTGGATAPASSSSDSSNVSSDASPSSNPCFSTEPCTDIGLISGPVPGQILEADGLWVWDLKIYNYGPDTAHNIKVPMAACATPNYPEPDFASKIKLFDYSPQGLPPPISCGISDLAVDPQAQIFHCASYIDPVTQEIVDYNLKQMLCRATSTAPDPLLLIPPPPVPAFPQPRLMKITFKLPKCRIAEGNTNLIIRGVELRIKGEEEDPSPENNINRFTYNPPIEVPCLP